MRPRPRSALSGLTLVLGVLISLLPWMPGTASPFDEEAGGTAVQGGETTAAAPLEALPKDLNEVLTFNQTRDCSSFYHPISAWTGRLILPTPDQRRPDGSVLITVTNSPEAGLIGRTLRLAITAADREDSWLETYRPDVTITPKAVAAAVKSGNKIPFGLNGWKRVSVLESLAAARPQEMEVALTAPRREGDRLIIQSEPVQIIGSQKALVRFVGPAKDTFRKVVHFDPRTASFTGPEEFVSISPQYFRKEADAIPMTDTAGIEQSAANREGWYLYGSPGNGVFRVEALEPRAALRLETTPAVTGRKSIYTYLAKHQFADVKPDLFRRVQWLPGEESLTENGIDAAPADPSHFWPVGSRGLLVHVFGWRKSPAEKGNSGVILGLVTGHFAFGQAEVVRCPITGEARWDIEYFQIYVHNPNGIVSGAQKWHAYMGSLKRGWMFTVPVSDTIVQLPGSGSTAGGTPEFVFLRTLRREFGLMMAVYRTGFGRGTTAVRTDISCVQDSHAALYATFRTFQSYLRSQGGPAGNSLRSSFDTLIKSIEKSITFHGVASGKWRDFFNQPTAQRQSNVMTVLFDSMLSAGTIFPRNGNDRLLELMADNRRPMWNILTSQIGGRIEGLVPLAPSSPRRH